LAAAAKGIVGLVKNGGNIRLITGAVFQEQDITAIKAAINTPERIIEKSMLEELEGLEEGFVKDHVRALGWLIAKGRLKKGSRTSSNWVQLLIQCVFSLYIH